MFATVSSRFSCIVSPRAARRFIKRTLLAAIFLAGTAGMVPANAETFELYTGGQGGVYYPVGMRVCDLLNRSHGTADCAAHPSAGSVENVERLRSGDADLAIVQSDILYYAYNGYGPFRSAGPFRELRSIVTLHEEAFTVLARRDSNIRTFADLRGKRVNIGPPGSGQHTFMELLMLVEGWSKSDLAEVKELGPDEQGRALCAGEVDAIVYVVGHPNKVIEETANACDTRLVEVRDRAVEKLVAEYPYIVNVSILGKRYPGSPSRVSTFGVRAALVTTSEQFPDDIRDLTQILFNGFIDLKFAHKSLFGLSPMDMAREATVPVHDGAYQFISRSTDLYKLMNVPPPRR